MIDNKNLLQELKAELDSAENELIKYKQILNYSPDPILITDIKAQIIYVNPAWEILTGYTLDEVLGKTPRILKSGKTPERVFRLMWRSLKRGKPFITEEVIDRKKDGTEYHIHATVFPVLKNNKAVFYVQMEQDITNRKHLDSLKTDFLSIASHEMKTPLTALSLITESLLRQYSISGGSSQKFILLDNQVKKLVSLLNELLDISRIETGKLHISFEEVDLVKLVKDTVDKMQIIAQNHKIIFETSEKAIIVYGDPNRLEEVITNLIANALKYSPEETTIRIKVEKHTNKLIVSVKDRGIGIPRHKLPLVFDRFYQVRAHKTNGFGLGLYIAKEIIRQHKGQIWANSKPGKGSIFYFSLPLRKPI